LTRKRLEDETRRLQHEQRATAQWENAESRAKGQQTNRGDKRRAKAKREKRREERKENMNMKDED
jgi:hypothetical protein